MHAHVSPYRAGTVTVLAFFPSSDGSTVVTKRRTKMPAAPLRSRGTQYPQPGHWHVKTSLPPRFSVTLKHLLQPAARV